MMRRGENVDAFKNALASRVCRTNLSKTGNRGTAPYRLCCTLHRSQVIVDLPNNKAWKKFKNSQINISAIQGLLPAESNTACRTIPSCHLSTPVKLWAVTKLRAFKKPLENNKTTKKNSTDTHQYRQEFLDIWRFVDKSSSRDGRQDLWWLPSLSSFLLISPPKMKANILHVIMAYNALEATGLVVKDRVFVCVWLFLYLLHAEDIFWNWGHFGWSS